MVFSRTTAYKTLAAVHCVYAFTCLVCLFWTTLMGWIHLFATTFATPPHKPGAASYEWTHRWRDYACVLDNIFHAAIWATAAILYGDQDQATTEEEQPLEDLAP